MSSIAQLSEIYLKLKRQEKALEEDIKRVRADMLEAIKEEEPDINLHEFTYVVSSKTTPYEIRMQQVAQQRLDSTLLKKEYPEVYMKCLTKTTQERFTVK